MHSYVAAALLSAEYEIESDGHTYASHPLLSNLSASGESFSVCRQRFRHLLERRLERAVESGEVLPVIGGVEPPLVAHSTPAPAVAQSHASSSI
jgi:hypothetical protein